VTGVLRSSCCLCSRCSRNQRVLQWPLTLLSHPNNDCKGKGKGKGKGKDKNNSFGGSGNNRKGSNTPAWPSFYNPWTDTISLWLGMRRPQQLVRALQHALLAALVYYGVPNDPSFMPFTVLRPHQQQAATPTWLPWMGTWD
jgi:hypothetical protein